MARTIWTDGTAAESLTVKWGCNSDPSAGTVEFAIQASTTDDAPDAGWTAGTIDSYDAASKIALTTTPTIGSSSASLKPTDGSTVVLWGRLSVGSEVIIRQCDTLIAR